MKKAKIKARTINEYLAPLRANQRDALEKLRKSIRAAVPKAEECISYDIPAFRLNGRLLVGFGAAVKHCSFYPGAYPIEVCKAELKGYGLSKGTIRFPVDKPLPAALVRRLVKARVAQHRSRSESSKY